jgi:hypothetical protein
MCYRKVRDLQHRVYLWQSVMKRRYGIVMSSCTEMLIVIAILIVIIWTAVTMHAIIS